MVLENARKAGHVPMGTFDRTLAKARWRRAYRGLNWLRVSSFTSIVVGGGRADSRGG
jgi:hypothetical protein